MTTEQKIGQHLAVGFEGTRVSERFKDLVRRYKIGNIILFRENLENRAQITSLCAELTRLVTQETGFPPFLTIDQEGGVVSRLPEDMIHVPGAMALSATGARDAAQLAARLTAAELAEAGINFNLAPVLDINLHPENPAIGVRSYGDTPDRVIRFGTDAIRSYADTGVLCCGKHFPGHGSTCVDSHLALPVVDRSLEQLTEEDLAPFAAAVKAGIPAIMTSHILFPQLEEASLPATLSRKIITGLLKETMGFQGLVLSDGMEMNAIKETYGTPQGCIRAIAAGVDLVFVCHDPDLMEQSAQAVAAAYRQGRFDEGAFDASTQKIIAYKLRQQKQLKAFLPTLKSWPHPQRQAEAEALTEKTLCVLPDTPVPNLGSAPYFVGCLSYRSTIASSAAEPAVNFPQWFASRLGGTAAVTSLDPEESEIRRVLSQLGAASSVVIGCYNGHFNPGQIRLANTLCRTAAERKLPVIAVALRDPYDLPLISPDACRIAAFEYSFNVFRALLGLFQKKYLPTGKLEVRL